MGDNAETEKVLAVTLQYVGIMNTLVGQLSGIGKSIGDMQVDTALIKQDFGYFQEKMIAMKETSARIEKQSKRRDLIMFIVFSATYISVMIVLAFFIKFIIAHHPNA